MTKVELYKITTYHGVEVGDVVECDEEFNIRVLSIMKIVPHAPKNVIYVTGIPEAAMIDDYLPPTF